MHKVSRSLLLVGVLAFGTLAACGEDTVITGGNTAQTGVSSITVSPPSATVEVGKSIQFAASVVTFDAATLKTVTWTVSPSTAGSVSGTGVFTAGTTAGTATVIATSVDPSKSAAGFVTITPAAVGTVTGIAFTTSGRNVPVGSTIPVTAAITGTSTNTTVNYTSSDVSVATVSATGVVTGIKNGVTTITATSAADASKSVTTVVTVGSGTTVNDPASVLIKSVTQDGLLNPVQLNNVQGQIDVTLTVERGSQTVNKVDLLVDDKIVATQTLSSASASAISGVSAAMVPTDITLSFNTAKFYPVDEPGHLAGDVDFKNGTHTIKAQITVNNQTSAPNASNSIAVTFNNTDGFYVTQTPVSTTGIVSAVDAAGRLWFQGGNGTALPAGGGGLDVRSVPVMYSGRTVQSRTLVFTSVGAGSACAAGCSPAGGPTTGAGVLSSTRIILPAALADTGIVSVANALATDGNSITLVGNGGNGVINAQVLGAPGVSTALLANATIGQRLTQIRIDNAVPATPGFVLAGVGSTAAPQVFNWVNGVYTLASGITINPDAGVGLVTATTANQGFAAVPVGGVTLANVTVSAGASGAATSTFTALSAANAPISAAQAIVPPSDVNLTYTAAVNVKDLLGNTSVTKVLDPNAANPNNVVVSAVTRGTFGVDLTAPQIRYADATGAGALAAAGILSRSTDSVRTTDAQTFVVDYIDDRSGFVGSAAPGVPAGTPMFRSVARLSNSPNPRVGPGVISCVSGTLVVASGTCTQTGVAYGTVLSDFWVRSAPIQIDGDAAGNNLPGYFTFNASVRDMAGNTSVTVAKRSAVDPAAPALTGFLVPTTITGGQSADFIPTADDDLELGEGQLTLNYPLMSLVYPFTGYSDFVPGIGIKWDGTLTTPFSPGLRINNFIDQIETVDGANAPVNSATVAVPTARPTSATADVRDVFGTTSGTPFTNPILSSAWTQAAASWATIPAASGGSVASWRVVSSARTPATGTQTGTTITVEVVGPTGQALMPFQSIQIWQLVGGLYTRVEGTYDAPIGIDNGTNRIWTVVFRTSTVLTTGASVRALGIGNSITSTAAMLGNALATNTFVFP